MAVTAFLAILVLSLIQFPQPVGDELDGATCERMQQRAEQMNQEMARLLQELEQQRSLVQRFFAWGALLVTAVQQWHVWAVAGVSVLLFGLCWWLRRRSHQPASSGEDQSCSCAKEQDREEEQEGEESEGEDFDDGQHLVRIFAKRMQWSLPNLAYRSGLVEELVGDLLGVLQEFLANSLFPLLQPAVGVGSTFEGWSPDEDQAVYRLLVPLRPPHGHAFHLELGTSREILAKGSRVRVELECTCTWEQLVENTPCFLHYPEEELRRKPSLLSTLCSGSYLDVQKTARWLQNLVRSAWLLVPQSRHYNMKVLPSSRSCKLQLTNIAGVTLCVELLFGVQQGSSDIFLSSQAREAIFTPSTMWPESYAVAEAKFFRHMALHDTCHLKCLQVCTRILMGTGFSNYIMKTVVMHLLNTIPPSRWSREEFLLWLQHIMEYLHGCLEEKRLNHFFFGNENVPKEIVLPPTFELAEPLNLFQHLLHDKHAHAKALLEFDELQDRLTRPLFYGH